MLPLSLLILFAHPVVDTVVITNNIVVFAVVTPSRNIANVLLTTAITASLVYIIVQDHYSLCCSPSNHFPYNFHVSYIYYIYYGVCNHCNYWVLVLLLFIVLVIFFHCVHLVSINVVFSFFFCMVTITQVATIKQFLEYSLSFWGILTYVWFNCSIFLEF